MNQRQRAFAEHYAATGNAAEAARAAGYSERTARTQGQRLLTNADIQWYIHELQSKASRERIANAEEIGSTLTGMLRDDSLAAGTRIRAANALLRAGGAFLPPAPPVVEMDTADEHSDDEEVRICLPYTPRDAVQPNAVQLPSGDVIPFAGHEGDDTLIFAPLFLVSEADFAAKEDEHEPEHGSLD